MSGQYFRNRLFLGYKDTVSAFLSSNESSVISVEVLNFYSAIIS